MATESLRASGFAARQTLKQMIAKHGATASFHWSNWGKPTDEDLGLPVYTIWRDGWEFGIMAGCLLLTRPDRKGDKTLPAEGEHNAMVAGRVVEAWPYMWERVADSSLLPLLLLKVEVMPKQFILVSVCVIVLKSDPLPLIEHIS